MATLEKWTPLPDLDIVERRMRRFFEDVGIAPSMTPAADVYETGEELVVELDVPGFDEHDLAVALIDHTLAISGTRVHDTATKEKDLRLRERPDAYFKRRFHLPVEADTEHVTAEYSKGVLTLHVPKLAAAKPRTVKIVKK
jgi:HSP20 family protein